MVLPELIKKVAQRELQDAQGQITLREGNRALLGKKERNLFLHMLREYCLN